MLKYISTKALYISTLMLTSLATVVIAVNILCLYLGLTPQFVQSIIDVGIIGLCMWMHCEVWDRIKKV